MSKAAELAALIGSGQAQGDKNFVINGGMTINQRGASTGVTNANSGYFGPDRYKFNEDGTMTAVVSIQQETLTSGNAFNDGHLYAYKLSVTTADTAVAADIYTRITHRFEKDNLASLSKGSSSAKRVTLSFWVKATVTGTNVVEFFDQVNSRQVGATYTISSSNTWEYKTVTFPADTSGALGSGNGLAAEINFVLQAGSNYTSGTLDTSWASETAANRAAGHNSNHFSSTSNTFHFTGVQLEIGDVATPFEHRSYGDELARCQRYYQYIGKGESYGHLGLGIAYNTTGIRLPVQMRPVGMRTIPSIASSGSIRTAHQASSPNVTGVSIATSESTDNIVGVNVTVASGLTQGYVYGITNNNDTNAHIAFSAEL